QRYAFFLNPQAFQEKFFKNLSKCTPEQLPEADAGVSLHKNFSASQSPLLKWECKGTTFFNISKLFYKKFRDFLMMESRSKAQRAGFQVNKTIYIFHQ
ncbi:MAG: hypothetical protein IJX11_00255, partial [Bacteroidales bacterium]|nr:hypothetical protein [Bacteroidales bacterium]